MNPKKTKFIVGSMLIVGAVAYLISAGISTTSQYFFTVDELMAQTVSYEGAGLKIKGNVVNGSINRDPDDYLKVRFAIEEKESNLQVVYKGITPDMFQDGGEVVVEGTLDKEGVFHANVLMTSCPSKYEAEKEAGKTHPGSLPLDNKKGLESEGSGSKPKTSV
ncbi:MAG: cytochrome c maturation protein CcmE [Candidatus Nitrohelix vancouverensis]|uniref:Cytochrome c maturation protein CcmE n=1 Tax=Candidatus Nitrohelix vancouverensis TaxID=2705534 RepID=A0A7T0G4Q1_9BACT|nr:MAG: cytochrome c maturation protein CcmE [Candidatus Nitrohelix vancouverensis]